MFAKQICIYRSSLVSSVRLAARNMTMIVTSRVSYSLPELQRSVSAILAILRSWLASTGSGGRHTDRCLGVDVCAADDLGTTKRLVVSRPFSQRHYPRHLCSPKQNKQIGTQCGNRAYPQGTGQVSALLLSRIIFSSIYACRGMFTENAFHLTQAQFGDSSPVN